MPLIQATSAWTPISAARVSNMYTPPACGKTLPWCELFHASRQARYTEGRNGPRLSTKRPQMNATMEMNSEDMLRVRLEMLRREHRDLDDAIHALDTSGRADQLTLRRFKKQKLALKDMIAKIEDRLIPDIIA